MGWVVINEVQDPVTETIEKVYGRTNVRINTWLNVREVSDNQGGPPECRLWGKSVDEETDVGHALHKKFTKIQVRVPRANLAADRRLAGWTLAAGGARMALCTDGEGQRQTKS